MARFLRTYSGRPELYEERREELQARGTRALEALEQGLEGGEWLVGDRMSLADITLYAYTHVAGEGGFSLEAYPAILDWLARVAAQRGHVPIDT